MGGGALRPVALFAISIVIVSVAVGAPASSLINAKVVRKVVLSGNGAVHTVAVTARNDGPVPVASYDVALSAPESDNLAHCQLIVGSGAGRTSSCQMLPADTNLQFAIYRVEFDEPIQPGDSLKFRLSIVIVHSLQPLPRFMKQGAVQKVLAHESSTWLSPYETTMSTSKFHLGTSNIVSFTEGGIKKTTSITYKQSTPVQPLTWTPIELHFEHEKALATATSIVKEIHVSHWGNIAVEENYVIQNSGALLQGEYSRVDYDRNHNGKIGAFQWITAHLPANSRDLYYRDSIGNVSTSAVRNMKKQVHFEIATRYPLFGGWKTDFYFGYNLPAQYALYSDKDTGRFVLDTLFGTPFDDLVIDDFVVHVVLPEGAHNIKWDSASIGDIVQLPGELRHGVLDIRSRPVITLRKHNVVSKFHSKPLQVTYELDGSGIYTKPLLLIAGFLMFFGASILYARIDLTLTPAMIKKKQQ